MFSELKMSPRSVSSRLQALRIITASGSSSSSASATAVALEGMAIAVPVPLGPAGSTLTGAVFAEKSWSWVSRLMARRPELESRSVSVFT
jgi:hypothetical protein